jgi:hypothetical protein
MLQKKKNKDEPGFQQTPLPKMYFKNDGFDCFEMPSSVMEW